LKSGYDLVKWLISCEIDKTLKISEGFTFKVHSQNPIGKKNIISLLNRYLTYRIKNRYTPIIKEEYTDERS